jgi:hypothetical protein
MRFAARATALALFLASCSSSSPNINEPMPTAVDPNKVGPWLWRISSDDAEPSYLYASPGSEIHPSEVPELVWRTLAESRIVITPLVDGPPTVSFTLPGDQSIEDTLAASEMKRLRELLLGIDLRGDVQRLHPAFIVSQLLSSPRYEASVDIDASAREKGIPVAGIESIDDLIGQAKQACAFTCLRRAIKNLESLRADSEAQTDAYRSGDLARMATALESDRKLEERDGDLMRLRAARAARWIEKTRPELDRGRAFLAASVETVLGPNGLLEQLRAAGYQVVPVAPEMPATAPNEGPQLPTVAKCRNMWNHAAELLEQQMARDVAELGGTFDRDSWRAKVASALEWRLINLCLRAPNTAVVDCQLAANTAAEAFACPLPFDPPGNNAAQAVAAADAVCKCTNPTCVSDALTRLGQLAASDADLNAGGWMEETTIRLMFCVRAAGLGSKQAGSLMTSIFKDAAAAHAE